MAAIEHADWQRAADELHVALVAALATAPSALIEEADWDFDDEDWLRDAVESTAAYAEWRLKGTHPFAYLRPELKVGPVLADHLAYAARAFGPGGDPGWSVPPARRRAVQDALDTYVTARPPNAGGEFGFERWSGNPQPRDNPPAASGPDTVRTLP